VAFFVGFEMVEDGHEMRDPVNTLHFTPHFHEIVNNSRNELKLRELLYLYNCRKYVDKTIEKFFCGEMW